MIVLINRKWFFFKKNKNNKTFQINSYKQEIAARYTRDTGLPAAKNRARIIGLDKAK